MELGLVRSRKTYRVYSSRKFDAPNSFLNEDRLFSDSYRMMVYIHIYIIPEFDVS